VRCKIWQLPDATAIGTETACVTVPITWPAAFVIVLVSDPFAKSCPFWFEKPVIVRTLLTVPTTVPAASDAVPVNVVVSDPVELGGAADVVAALNASTATVATSASAPRRSVM
jgi:hypothetical protein